MSNDGRYTRSFLIQELNALRHAEEEMKTLAAEGWRRISPGLLEKDGVHMWVEPIGLTDLVPSKWKLK